MSQGDSGDGDIDIAKIAREEAHRTIDSQIQTLDDIDSKAARLLRLNLILLGIVLTGLSLAAPAESGTNVPIAYADLANRYNVAGVILLLFSTGVAAVTYTASSLQAGAGPEDLKQMINNDYSDRENLEGLVESYAEWIQYNYTVNAKNAPLGTLTLLLLILAMVAFSLGVKNAISGTVEWWLLLIVGLLLAAVIWFTGFIGQIMRWYRVRDIK